MRIRLVFLALSLVFEAGLASIGTLCTPVALLNDATPISIHERGQADFSRQYKAEFYKQYGIDLNRARPFAQGGEGRLYWRRSPNGSRWKWEVIKTPRPEIEGAAVKKRDVDISLSESVRLSQRVHDKYRGEARIPPLRFNPTLRTIEMPFLGKSLQEQIHDFRVTNKRKALTTGEALLKIASALKQIHSVGLVHRDVKPGNIVVDRAGEFWLVDLGLLSEEGKQLPGTPRFDPKNAIVGSPNYGGEEYTTKPEADRGQDVHALWLTGQAMVNGTEAHIGSVFDVVPAIGLIAWKSASGFPQFVGSAASANFGTPDALSTATWLRPRTLEEYERNIRLAVRAVEQDNPSVFYHDPEILAQVEALGDRRASFFRGLSDGERARLNDGLKSQGR